MNKGRIAIVGLGTYAVGLALVEAHAEIVMLHHVMENHALVVVDSQREENLVKKLIFKKQKELELNILNPLVLLNTFEYDFPVNTDLPPTKTILAKENAICANHCIAGKNKHCIQPRAPANKRSFFLHFYRKLSY